MFILTTYQHYNLKQDLTEKKILTFSQINILLNHVLLSSIFVLRESNNSLSDLSVC